MVKKQSSFTQHGPYLAIVAVVAVVAIVFLILNFAGVSPVGEASKFYVPKEAVKNNPVCVANFEWLYHETKTESKLDSTGTVKVPKIGTTVGLWGNGDYYGKFGGNEPSKNDVIVMAKLFKATKAQMYDTGWSTLGIVVSAYTDYCFKNNILIEYYCDAANPEQVSTKVYDCITDFGVPCVDGACKFLMD